MNTLRRRGSLLVVALAALVMTAACGGSGKPAAAAGSGSTTTTDPRAAYTACLRERGINFPERPPRPGGAGATPGSGTPTSHPPGSDTSGIRPSIALPPGVDPAAVQAARQACQSLLPADRNGRGGSSPVFQAYASCLKDHGVVLPDNGGFAGVNRDDAPFKAADTLCAPLRPNQSTDATPTTRATQP